MRFNNGMLVRGVSAVVLGGSLVLLAACGGSSNNILGSGVTIGLSPSTRSLTPGAAATVAATVSKGSLTWTASPASFGALSSPSATGVTYTAPTSVTMPTVVTITATSTTSASVSAPVQIVVQPSPTIALEVGGKAVGPQTINVGRQLSVNAFLTGDTMNKGVTWTLSPSSGSGSLSNQTTTSVTYNAPGAAVATPVSLVATAVANTGSTSVLELNVLPSGARGNVAALTTAGGPNPPGTNTFFTSVTVCIPGTSTCQTIDNIEVDTGSEGLRILQSAMTSIALPQVSDGAGDYLNNCVAFLDGSFFWGPVGIADIYIGGEESASTPIQIISSGNPTVPAACVSGSTTNDNTPTLLGANGLLGIGPEPTDCISQGQDGCDPTLLSVLPNYFLCASSGCSTSDGPIGVLPSQEVLNPVVGFTVPVVGFSTPDDNGSSITFPAVGTSAPSVNGTLIFGIGETNNVVPITATVLTMNNLTQGDFFTTQYNGQNLGTSFIDTGSNGYFFPSSITPCPNHGPDMGFYCDPSVLPQMSGTNIDPSGHSMSNVVNFNIENAANLSSTDSAFGTIGGPGGTDSFDWGAPFFYGRTVVTGIDGQTVTGFPFYAYF